MQPRALNGALCVPMPFALEFLMMLYFLFFLLFHLSFPLTNYISDENFCCFAARWFENYDACQKASNDTRQMSAELWKDAKVSEHQLLGNMGRNRKVRSSFPKEHKRQYLKVASPPPHEYVGMPRLNMSPKETSEEAR